MITLRILRERKGVPQQTVADSLEITRQAYSNYENGNREPDNKMLLKLAEYFGVSTDYLLGRKESKSPGMDESIPRDDGERKLIQIVRKLDPAQKALLLRLVETAVENSERPQNP